MFVHRLAEGVALQLLERRHADALFALIDRNRPHLGTWLPWVDWTLTVQDSKTHIAGSTQRWADGKGLEAGIWCDGNLAGVIGFHDLNTRHQATSIGYWLGAEFQGRGLMTMACRALIDHAVDTLDLHRIEIRCAVDNRPSRAIPERLGFRAEGTLQDSFWLRDRFWDMAVYGMTAPRWRAQRQDEA